ncbi:MAG TPA: hypothetical protein VGK14_02960 [Novimethylophilus sp.]|jgi:hypothetical protein|uniref:hypothetical protein n=1 Tax=Novimethylophilus sp. TaxID=2137426 RepID=UPI002F41AFBC
MFKRKLLAGAVALACGYPMLAAANDSDEIEKLRAEMQQTVQQMKQSYEARIQALENKLEQVQGSAGKAVESAARAEIAADQAAANRAPASGNAFNPDISLILSGIYANRSQNSDFHITGFQTGGAIGPGLRGLSLAESELGVYANIDHYFYGGLNLALAPDNTVGVEEAFVQTTSLPAGLTVKGGRFFSGIGYLNEQHAHTWDFVDNPLAYQAFLGGQFGDDGVQIKWVAPTNTFIELGAEAGRGRIADTAGKDKNGAAMGSAFGHVGGDIGISSSWRAGLSYLRASPSKRLSSDLDTAGNFITNQFSGTSRLWIADFVWKWAPNGNINATNFKLQGEYLHRSESGTLTYDVDTVIASADRYHASQSGWYVQGVYQFMPYWRTGLRYDRLGSGSTDYASNNAKIVADGYNPDRISLMMDYSPSEFSRIRLQLARDRSREHATDNQFFVQYIMSLGAHGAHKF